MGLPIGGFPTPSLLSFNDQKCSPGLASVLADPVVANIVVWKPEAATLSLLGTRKPLYIGKECCLPGCLVMNHSLRRIRFPSRVSVEHILLEHVSVPASVFSASQPVGGGRWMCEGWRLSLLASSTPPGTSLMRHVCRHRWSLDDKQTLFLFRP